MNDMEFLGQLGIDLRLLVSQIINFGLLLWILTKFLYRPVIKRIEEDEKKLRSAEIKEKEMQKENAEFLVRNRRELRSSKRRAREIIEEAESVSKSIKKRAEKTASKEKKAIVNRYMEIWDTEKEELKVVLEKEVEGRVMDNLHGVLKKVVVGDVRKGLQKAFLNGLLREIEALPSEPALKVDTPLLLEYAFSLTPEDKKRLHLALSEKLGRAVTVTEKKNPGFIVGFRLDIGGMLITSNLLQEMTNAAEAG